MSIMQTLFSGRTQNFTFVTSVINNSSTITIPSTANSGDFAVLFDSAVDVSIIQITSVTPSGWTNILDDDYFDFDLKRLKSMISYKVLTSNDPNSTITGMNSTTETKLLLVFRPDFQISGVSYFSIGQSTAGNPAPQTLPLSGIIPSVVSISQSFSQGSNDEPSYTSTVTMNQINNIFSSTLRQLVKYLSYNTNDNTLPSDNTIDSGDGGYNILQSAYFTFT